MADDAVDGVELQTIFKESFSKKTIDFHNCGYIAYEFQEALPNIRTIQALSKLIQDTVAAVLEKYPRPDNSTKIEIIILLGNMKAVANAANKQAKEENKINFEKIIIETRKKSVRER